ncbi:DUF2505 domain-containing protein [Rhodococcus sp. SGAir0479]|uniref:DUF2505 domain-containing protein n=1 Tax=Rhodococcus sp. SGAir0479 TaxID=2567884 RepID=UPI0010CD2BE7|nr:DUF2505 domain-containing protein [Rhodococcus sp. SGAir0479]QCQ92363.1 DUF2505 domain-containing protein [Rhodococcus sp. SGAir0479]
MARRIDYSARFDHPAEKVYAALSDPDHWEARMEEMRKYSENHLESLKVTDDGIDLVLHHVLPRRDLPDIAQAVLKKDLVITRKERYTPFGEPVTGTYEASIPAGPGSLTGTMELFSTDTGCTLRTTSEAKVFLPFVGGKLEQLMLANLVDLFRNEAAITAAWLAQQ